MARDNNTGKTKGFYERGQAIFGRIPVPTDHIAFQDYIKEQQEGEEMSRCGMPRHSASSVLCKSTKVPEASVAYSQTALAERHGAT